MFAKLFSALKGGGPPPQTQTFEQSRWEESMKAGRALFDRNRYDRAIQWFTACLSDDMPDLQRQETLYPLAVANLRDDRNEDAERLFAELEQLTRRLGGQHELVSTLNLWAKSLESRGEAEAAKPVRQRHLEVTAALTDYMWETDDATGDVIHRSIGVRFPQSFRGYQRTHLSFERNDGTSGIVYYEVPPPHRSKAVIKLNVTDSRPAAGLNGLADEAVWWMGVADASYQWGQFKAGSGSGAPTGVRRLWPVTEKEGANWVLETYFAAFGQLHISFLVAHVVGEFDPEDIQTLLAEFDWPR